MPDYEILSTSKSSGSPQKTGKMPGGPPTAPELSDNAEAASFHGVSHSYVASFVTLGRHS
jgi:hypothetical protein